MRVRNLLGFCAVGAAIFVTGLVVGYAVGRPKAPAVRAASLPAAGHKPLSIREVIPASDLAFHGGVGEGIVEVVPQGQLTAEIPEVIIDIIRQDSGEQVGGSVKMHCSGLRATEVEPCLEGACALSFDLPLLGRQDWEYKIVESECVPCSISSLNTCAIDVVVSGVSYRIYATWDVVKTGTAGDDLNEQIEGAIHWLGPFRLPWPHGK